jgi:hypothetical protein
VDHMSTVGPILTDSLGEALSGPFAIEVISATAPRAVHWDGAPDATAGFASPTAALIAGLAEAAADREIAVLARRASGQDYVFCRIDRDSRSRFFTAWRPWTAPAAFLADAQDVA